MENNLNIAISFLSGASYGGATYANGLICALASVDKANVYHIFVLKDSPLVNLVKQNNFFFHQCLSANPSSWRKLLWEQLMLPKLLKKKAIDVMFTTKNITVFGVPCKVVISIRNMEPFCYSQYSNHWRLNLSSWLRKVLTEISIRRADGIIAVSHSTKSHVDCLLPNPNGKVDVIYNGAPSECHPVIKTDNKEDLFLFSASKFVAYANQLNLIDAYALLARRNDGIPPLWLAGGVHDNTYYKKVIALIERHRLTDKIKILGLVSRQRMMHLYSDAMLFVFPSTLEACPQTLIEAMSHGLSIATSDSPPMPEICQNAAVYFNPNDPMDIAEKIDELLTSSTMRNDLRKKALARSRFFDWNNTAAELVDVFRKVCGDK